MEDQVTPPKKFKVPHIPHESIITLEVSGTFVKKCQTLLLAMADKLGQEKTEIVLTKFRDTTASPEDTDEVTMFIMTALVGSLEKAAVDQGKVQYMDLTEAEMANILTHPSKKPSGN